MKYFTALVCFLYLFTLNKSEVVDKDEKVSLQITEKSKLIGIKDQTTPGKRARSFYSFRGIPYAEAPIGEKRWMESKLLKLTKPEYDATNYGPPCTQWWKQQFGSEDCLFVNVFTPKLPEKSSTDKGLLPVMLYIHGGGYIFGFGSAIGPKLLMKEDVVLVTFNYRLGVFGYLSTGDKNLPGNYGALDQITVLDWVQKHIHKFGGDPQSVTIFGHSAGGAASHFMTISPLARGKVHKAILQSGTSVASWVLDRNPSGYAEAFAKRVGCTDDISSTNLVKCLKKKTSEELIAGQIAPLDYWILPLHLQHVVDKDSRGANAFLPEEPEVLLDSGRFERIPIMAGVTSYEGIMAYTFLHLDEGDKFSDTEHFRNKIVPRVVGSLLPYGHAEDVPKVSPAVLREYFPGDGELTDDEKIRGMIEILGDTMFYSGNWNVLQKYADKGLNKVYSYVFTHMNKKTPSTVWDQVKQLRDRKIDHSLLDTGMSHVDDMYYLFEPCELFPSNPDFKMSKEDIEFSEFVTGIWAAFAKNGNPDEGIKKRKGYPEWKPLDLETGHVNYYNLTNVPAPMGGEFHAQKSLFWKRVYQSLAEKNDDFRIIDEL